MCKYCGGYDYWAQFCWKNGRQMCRECYKTDWKERNGWPYPWHDLDKSPFPTEEEIAAAKRENRMKIVEKSIKDFTILPGPPGTCPECGIEHEPGAPHNVQSIIYQFKFYQKNGRWPTWTDAMAHCNDETKTFWSEELTAMGIDFTKE